MHMRYILIAFMLGLSVLAVAQNTQSSAQIKQQMAKIRQSTNWDDPAAAKKANEEIRKLAGQLTGTPYVAPQQQANNDKPGNIEIKPSEATERNVVAIADRFFQRSYKALDAISKSQFDQDFKNAGMDDFSHASVNKLTSTGAIIITLGSDHNLACVYLTAAVKAQPNDTLGVNNFGGYLRVIDSIKTSLPVLLYANTLYNQSPLILTQIGCSYAELNDDARGEKYLKEALKYNPGFGQAHTALCDLYLRQKRLQDAILELFAGVKGMGFSYMKASNNFAQIQSQSETNGDTKGDFWGETKKQMDPSEALAPLVRGEAEVKMPDIPNCPTIEAWEMGGGYSAAVMAYKGLHDYMISFAYEFQDVNKQLPPLSENAVLRDYPDCRFALDCITEMFMKESKDKEDEYSKILDPLIDKVNAKKEEYLENLKIYTDEFKRCSDGCGTNAECEQECFRRFCSKECPNANKFNSFLEGEYENWTKAYKDYVENQKKTLDDLYAFTNPWLEKIKSPYWYRVYSYEVKRVALSIVGTTFMHYPQPFQNLSANGCGTDCSVWALTSPMFAKELPVNKEKPEEKECSPDSRVSVGLLICGVNFDCESIEFGCAAGVAMSAKRNFKNKSSTLFVGAGGELELVGASAGIKTGLTLTKSDNGDVDVGGKFEMEGKVGGPVSVGKSFEISASVMEGSKIEQKNVIGFGF